MHGVRAPGGVYTHVCGCDLVRDGDGQLAGARGQRAHAVGDLLRAGEPARDDPADARAVHRPPVRPVDHYPSLLLDALRAVAPAAESQPTVVAVDPGPINTAYFEHAFLARQMGVELVEASDLVVRDAVCYMRTTAGLQRVHTIYRRLDDDFIDPLEFRPDSLLGVPGLVRAYRAGTVAIANAIGTGVADDKAIYHYVPEMIRFYLERGADPGERPDLPAERRPSAPSSALPAARARRQADVGVRRQGRVHRSAGDRRRARAPGAPDRGPAEPSSPRSWLTSRRCRPSPATGGWRPATSICARSPSSARRSGSSPAG